MLNLENQTAKANLFRDLHRGPGTLLLPNAWDVASARILEEAGVAAIATTSAGIAFGLGYPDGQKDFAQRDARDGYTNCGEDKNSCYC